MTSHILHMGQHNGLMYHTIGQRQGLGIGGVKGAGDTPWYVVDKDLTQNRLLVAQGDHHPALYKDLLTASQPTWINPMPEIQELECMAKIRYRQADQRCRITFEKERLVVAFAEPQRAVTPGQSIVFYIGEQCLGGAVIDAGYNADHFPLQSVWR